MNEIQFIDLKLMIVTVIVIILLIWNFILVKRIRFFCNNNKKMDKKEYLEIRKELIKYYETGEATQSLVDLIEKYDYKYGVSNK